MYQNKTVLLIGGGGTLGTYITRELLRLGCRVDVICLEDYKSQNEKLRYLRGQATEEYLREIVTRNHYHGIVNLIHYPDVEAYEPIHRLLTGNTDHLIFLSSYRVYADEQHPITESAPMLLDVSKDEHFLANEKYALAKARAERYIYGQSDIKNWTIVRPVISFSERRFDLVTRSGRYVIDCVAAGKKITLPQRSKNLTAGLDWAGNTGKIIANLLFQECALGQAYTISSAPNLTWGQVADIYEKVLGADIEWIDSDDYLREMGPGDPYWTLVNDRFFDRKIDNRKVLAATGLKDEDFVTIEYGLKEELKRLNEQKGAMEE